MHTILTTLNYLELNDYVCLQKVFVKIFKLSPADENFTYRSIHV